jgi:hypothetical protein
MALAAADRNMIFYHVGQNWLGRSNGSQGDTGSSDDDSGNIVSTAAASHYVMSAPAGVNLGQTATVRLLAYDADNHFVSDYSGTATLTSSDAAATLPATVTFDRGRALFQVTFGTAGLQTITASDESDASITATSTTNVAAPAATTQYVLTMPAGATAGTPVTVQITAADAQNFRVKSDNSTVNLTSSDAAATLPASITLVNGKATFQATFATTGEQTITATDQADASVTGAASTNVVDAAVPTHFVLSLKQGTAAGSPVTVVITADDATNHVVTNFSGTANLASSDAAATVPDSVALVDGRATFKVTFATAGLQTLTATDSTNPSLLGSVFTSVATPYFTMNLPSGVTAGVPVTVQLVAKAADNSVLSSYSGTANLTTSDAAATLPTSVTFANGRASFQVTFATTGQQTLGASDSVSASPASTATTNVAAAAVATHFVVTMDPGTTIGDATTVRVVAVDAQNHLVKNFSGTANVTSSDAAATVPASITFSNGQANFFQATFGTLGPQTVTVTDSADSSITGTATTNVAAEDVATHFVISLRPGAALGSPTRVILVAEDAQNHVVSNYSGTANLSSSDASATLPSSVTFTKGRATFEVTFATLGSQTITATDSVDSTITGTATTNVGNDAGGGRGEGFFGRFRGRIFESFRGNWDSGGGDCSASSVT